MRLYVVFKKTGRIKNHESKKSKIKNDFRRNLHLIYSFFQTQLENMSEEEFLRHKDALSAQKLEKPKRLSVQFGKYMTEISLQQYHFDR
jgi:secreted Zn-dependent insulinase-like peptidase